MVWLQCSSGPLRYLNCGDRVQNRLLAAALPYEEKCIRFAYMPTLVLFVVLSTVVFIALGISKGATSRSMIPYGLLMVAYVGYLAVWYPRIMRQRLFKCWETYDLEIGHDYLLRRQADIPDLRLQFDEVQAVERVQGRYLRVIGKTKSRAIAIPDGIDHFDQVLETVSSLRPVRLRTIEQWQKYRVFMAAGLLLFMIMLWATSPVVVIPLSLVMGSVIVWVFFWIRRNPNIPESRKRIAWIYWLFFVVCVLKLFVAVAEAKSVNAPAIVGNMLAYMLAFSPCVLLTFGWVRWWRVRPPRYWRNYAVAWGLATSSISAICLYGVLSYIQLVHIGHSNEHRLAMVGVYVGWPLSVLSFVAAIVGNGRSRVITWLAGGSLAVVWSIAFFYA
jgi:hypothetical protein